MTLSRKEGGRGLIDIQNLHNKQINTLRAYFHTKHSTSSLHHAIILADTNYTPLNLNNKDFALTQITPTDTQQKWAQKVLHGRHPADLNQQYIDKDGSNAWLNQGDLFPETEGFMIAIQDQVINTKNYKKYIIKDQTIKDDNCRACHTQTETIQHIISGCKTITQTDYKHRHDQVGKIIHQKISTAK